MSESIPDNIIQRACDIWGLQLHNPTWDNGDESEAGGMGRALSLSNMAHDAEKITDIEAQVERFKQILFDSIKEMAVDQDYVMLYVDYHPDTTLAHAAEEAGIPLSLFGCKKRMHIEADHVGASIGYAVPIVNHYTLAGDRWLVTTLQGTDMHKIIDIIEGGGDVGLLVEKS